MRKFIGFAIIFLRYAIIIGQKKKKNIYKNMRAQSEKLYDATTTARGQSSVCIKCKSASV